MPSGTWADAPFGPVVATTRTEGRYNNILRTPLPTVLTSAVEVTVSGSTFDWAELYRRVHLLRRTSYVRDGFVDIGYPKH